MSRNSPIPHLTIVVPILRDLAAFERTLISVLENRGADCEILVPHDGSYDDPFDLCDEVEFVVAEAHQLVDLVSAAVDRARGRFVHVLAEGICATHGWTDAALEKFEHDDAGAVAPVIRNADSGLALAAGWTDLAERLCSPAAAGSLHVDEPSPQMIGTYLQASFWRVELLRSLVAAFSSRHSIDAAYVYEHLMRQAGWRTVLATESETVTSDAHLPCESTSLGRGLRLRAIRNHFSGVGPAGSLLRSVVAATAAVLGHLTRPGYLPESLGQAAAPLARTALQRRIEAVELRPCDDQQVADLPENAVRNHRRAA